MIRVDSLAMSKVLNFKGAITQLRADYERDRRKILGLLLSIKLGLAGGACYYLAEEGIWKESEESEKVYNKIKSSLSPYVKEVTTQLKIEVPDLPSSHKMSYVAKQYWNAGVMKTFEFLGELPNHTSNLASSGVKAISENPEMKKFIESLSSPPKEKEPADKK